MYYPGGWRNEGSDNNGLDLFNLDLNLGGRIETPMS